MTAPIHDLIAIAFVRRTLLELGFQLNPELASAQAHVGPVEMWIHAKRSDLEGESPLAVLRKSDGQDRVRAVLEKLVSTGPKT